MKKKKMVPDGKPLGTDKRFVYIKITRGLFAAVSPEDAGRVKKIMWSASPSGKYNFCARHDTYGLMHRFILGGLAEGFEVDHINGCPLDNRRCNLRTATRKQQLRNTRGYSKSEYKGVSRVPCCSGEKYSAHIFADGKQYHLGRRTSAKEAALVYDEAARRLFGLFAFLNFPKAGETPPKIPRRCLTPPTQIKSRYSAQRRKTNRRRKYIGVSPHVGPKWRYVIMYGKKRFEKAGFETEESAAMARDEYILENHLPHQLNILKRKD